MAGERIKLTVKERDSRGSADARRLRKQGFIPGVLYGKGKSSYAIAVRERELRRVLTGAGGLHAILDVVLEGQSTTHASILKDYQQDPIRGHISHIDLHEVRLDQPIQASVTVQLIGEPAGVTRAKSLHELAEPEAERREHEHIDERSEELLRYCRGAERDGQPETRGAQMASPTHRPCRPGSKDRHGVPSFFAARRE